MFIFLDFIFVKESVSWKTVHLDSPETEKKWSRLASTIGHERLKLKKRKKIGWDTPRVDSAVTAIFWDSSKIR